MKGAIIVIVALLLVVYVAAQYSTAYKAKEDVAGVAEHYLDLVDDASIPALKQSIIRDAQQKGVTLAPDNITITFEDTDIQSVAQSLVGRKLGAQFKNKRATINVHYVAHVVGIPVKQEITTFRIRQVAPAEAPTSKAAQEVMDTP